VLRKCFTLLGIDALEFQSVSKSTCYHIHPRTTASDLALRRAGSLLSSVEAQIVLEQVENGDQAGATLIKLVNRES
jgi:hypothetical protein